MNNVFFEFRNNKDNSVINLDELDKMVCERFSLKYGNLNGAGQPDYGHFILDFEKYHQDYISWWGLIATVLWWGNIESGNRTMREVLDAYVFDVWKEAILWPDESVVLLSNLLKFLHSKDLYLYVWWG